MEACCLVSYTMRFGAGAMIFVISDEIIPETHRIGHEKLHLMALFLDGYNAASGHTFKLTLILFAAYGILSIFSCFINHDKDVFNFYVSV